MDEGMELLGRAVSRSDAAYPRRLLDLPSPPAVIFLVGGWHHTGPHVAVVGARDGTEDGIDVARDLASRLAREGAAVISGMARGIDAAAHEGALDAGGLSGAVLGTGIDQVYPRSNAALQSRLGRSLGLMSEVPPGAPAARSTFAARNRILAALADAVVVVQGRATSGALITAHEAARLGRPVGAVPWDSREPLAEAPHALIRAGATLVRSAEDVLALVGMAGDDRDPASEELPDAALTDPESRLYRALRERPLPLDRLAQAASLTAPELGAALLSLELQGLARREPGGFARKTRRR